MLVSKVSDRRSHLVECDRCPLIEIADGVRHSSSQASLAPSPITADFATINLGVITDGHLRDRRRAITR
jgi:hypothetical protein